MATAPPRQRGHDTGAKRKVTAEPDEGGIKAVRVLAKGWVVEWGEHLRDRLLDQSIEHRRYAEDAFASSVFGDFYAAHWRGLVTALLQLAA
ncbi:MAG: hypothetical protein R3F19_32860 [Verrucomicrobiales bacterium]